VTRPVFRGLRPGVPPDRTLGSERRLAVTRPVFRGLRHVGTAELRFPDPRACSDETRFQGIATGMAPPPPMGGPGEPCSDETRFQGIATHRLF